MERVKIRLENCYGIGSLDCEFDFRSRNVHAVYAPNGFMKSSFARTLRDLAEEQESGDLLFPERVSLREVLDQTGAPISGDSVLSIGPYDGSYKPRQALLLVNADLKQKYEEAIADIDEARKTLISALKKRSGKRGRKDTPETELLATFGGEDILEILEDLQRAANGADESLVDFNYSVIFSEKAQSFLNDSATLAKLETYVQQFEALVATSPILNAKFTHTQARQVQKTLTDSAFFDGGHWVVLNDSQQPLEVRAPEVFAERVEAEFNRVLNDKALRSAFDDLDRQMSGNVALRDLRSYLRDHPEFVARLGNLTELKKSVWGAYLHAEENALNDLVRRFDAGRSVIEDAVNQAKAEATDWQDVVDRFNQRFDVPFQLSVSNQADVVLKEDAPRVCFKFRDSGGTAQVPDDRELLKVLSQGERRALYLLNVLFEIRIRENADEPTLLVVDDIADSFDYRNKYAIIEYLQDVCRSQKFRLIVLSHNYDFHRSASSRLGIHRHHRWMAVKSGREIRLVEEKYQKNPWMAWKGS